MWIVIWNFPLFVALSIFKTILSWELAEVSNEKSAKFQTTIHIDYDREENKTRFLMVSQTKMIRTLLTKKTWHNRVTIWRFTLIAFRRGRKWFITRRLTGFSKSEMFLTLNRNSWLHAWDFLITYYYSQFLLILSLDFEKDIRALALNWTWHPNWP